MHLLYRILCHLFFQKPKAVPFFRPDPQLERVTKELCMLRASLVGWSLYGDTDNPNGQQKAKEQEKELVARLSGAEGARLKEYLKPYIEVGKEYQSYGKGEHARWYMSEVIKDHPNDDYHVLRR